MDKEQEINFSQSKLFKDAQETLLRTKDILSTEDRWTKNCNARNNDGKEVNPFSPNACRFCLQGAILKANKEITGQFLSDINLTNVGMVFNLNEGYVIMLNDHDTTTFQDIQSKIDSWLYELDKFINKNRSKVNG